MADEQINNKVAEFMQLTGADKERAQFYLQSANWQLHTAVDTFFDNDDYVSLDQNLAEDELFSTDHTNEHQEQTETPLNFSSSKNEKEFKKKIKKTGFATIGQLNEDSSSEEEGQAFFAGGSESSGQQILGPKKTKGNLTKELFKSAKQHGALALSENQISDNEKGKTDVFKGAGFTLGSDFQSSMQVSASLTDKIAKQPIKHVAIKFWKNGFSVDNGPLRNFNDPVNKEFLSSISKGDVPVELKHQLQNGEVHVDMEDHGEEEYKKPKENPKSFEGTGYTLGSPTPQVIQEFSTKPVSSSSNALQSFSVDDSKPVTTIQIRLIDGTRLISKFNYDNTIGDIVNLVKNARPSTDAFYLMTTFPNKIFNDLQMTILDAKLLNAVIVQRIK